jgi:transcription elongation factor GreA
MGVEDRVIFGSTVTIKDIETDEIKKYQIVGDAEADIEHNTISFTTPMAHALLKKELGEFIEVHTPGGDKEFEIINIELN